MELPFEKTVCRYWKQKLYTLLKTEETQELKIPESMPDVGRIISSWAQVILRGKDWRDRNIGINGGVMVWILYAPEDGGDLRHLESWIPFQVRTDLPEGGADGVIRVESFLHSMDARAVSSRRIMIRTGIDMLVQALGSDELELTVPGEMPDDLELRKEVYPFVLTREAGEKTFLMEEELNLPSGLPKPEQVVYYRLTPEILEQKVMGSKAAFRGMGALHLLYMDDQGRLTGTDLQIPFAQYVDLEGEYQNDAQISNILCVTSLELDLGADGMIRLKCGLVSQYAIDAPESVEVEKELLSVPAWLDHQKQSIAMSTSVPAEGNSCVDLLFSPAAPEIRRRGESVDVELGGVFQGLMVGQDGRYESVQGKAGDTVRMESACDTICFTACQGSPSCRPEASSWRTDTRVLVDLRSLCCKPMEVVTGIDAGETGTPDPERPSVIIRSKGSCESLWDLAKRCGSTVGAIKRLNRLEGEPDEDRLLLIPVI